MPRGKPPKVYDDALVDRVRSLYAAGRTQAEVAQALSLSQKVIWNIMRRHAIPARPAVPRDQRGPRNGGWRGADAGYQAMHARVEARRGQPKRCQRCGTTDPHKTYDWANLTGRYDDPDDYERMCRSCHRQYDNARRVREVVLSVR